jgi:hypothetical protein
VLVRPGCLLPKRSSKRSSPTNQCMLFCQILQAECCVRRSETLSEMVARPHHRAPGVCLPACPPSARRCYLASLTDLKDRVSTSIVKWGSGTTSSVDEAVHGVVGKGGQLYGLLASDVFHSGPQGTAPLVFRTVRHAMDKWGAQFFLASTSFRSTETELGLQCECETHRLCRETLYRNVLPDGTLFLVELLYVSHHTTPHHTTHPDLQPCKL